MSNRLADETSPYLLQHAENPVDWFPWGPEAFAKAHAEDKPVFLSVGYSACHWCHVMEHESFENERTAALMNERFVSVKVDREERPDVDAIYMDAVQTLTGSGGWPMSVFLTPDAVPFYGGTYFPDKPRFGMPAFGDLLTRVSELWTTRREEILEAASGLKDALAPAVDASGAAAVPLPLDAATLDAAAAGLTRTFDERNGGWGGAPKFPQPAVVEFVLRRHLSTSDPKLLEMVTRTLDAMMSGGIYDQLGGGFHRYATDDIWLVPHFEKMLYDNAQLARVYLHGFQVTRDPLYRRIVTETLDYVATEMLDPDGGFYSAQDADSQGEEGRFFVWTPSQIRDSLGEASEEDARDAELFISAYGVTESGNFEGRNILHLERGGSEDAGRGGHDADEARSRIDRARCVLLETRGKRVRPGLDDKVLASWNGMMLAAFAEAARVLHRDDYLAIAERNAGFILGSMRTADGRMLRTWKDGRARLNGYLEDYANVADGLLELYQATFDLRWFGAAQALADSILDHFTDPEGGFFDTSDDHETLLVRPKNPVDGALPSGGAMAASVLARLAPYTGDGRYAGASERALAPLQRSMAQAPLGFAQWLSVLEFTLSPPNELAIVGGDPSPMLELVRSRYRPNLVVAAGAPGEDGGLGLLVGRDSADGRATAYVCRGFACQRPVTDTADLESLLS